jgi:hypothetical protein
MDSEYGMKRLCNRSSTFKSAVPHRAHEMQDLNGLDLRFDSSYYEEYELVNCNAV